MKLLPRFVLSKLPSDLILTRWEIVLKNSSSLLGFTGLLQMFYVCRLMGLCSVIVI